jgi:hypothetical protein
MRAIHNLSDVQLVLNAHDTFINKFNSQSINRQGLKLTNNGKATDPGDYVILSQLPTPTTPVNPAVNQYYTAVFTQSGIINTGDVIPAFIAGFERTGLPVAVKVVALTPPTSTCTINIAVGAGVGLMQNILAADLSIPIGSNVVISSSNFINPVPYVGTNFIMYPVITSGGGAGVVTIEIVLQRSQNAQ